jgi:phenylacetate 2-hydroxylase
MSDRSDSATGTPHYGYGVGSRVCVASHLANRKQYTAFLRIFISLDILPARD